LPDFVSQILRFVLRLVMAVFAIIFAVSLLFAALIALLFSLLMALFTGRKPVSPMVFSRFKRFSKDSVWPADAKRSDGSPIGGPSRSGKSGKPGEVVDVEVREVKDDKPQ
jgi:hypothetical protein